ncbi:MAG: ABC transporter permease subunit [Acidiferrobacterales bacterium]
MIWTIAARELKGLFLSPLAWVVLTVVQAILAFIFLTRIEEYLYMQPQLLALDNPPGVTELVVGRLFGSAAIVLLLVVPLLTMRLVSEERRNHTLTLLRSAPISATEIVLGKYLGALLFIFILLLLIALMPLSLYVATTLDIGVVLSGLVGLALLLAGFIAVGLFMSTLTQHPTVASVATFGVLLLFWLLGSVGSNDSGEASWLASLSSLNHYEPFLRGVFDSNDAVYHVLFVATFLVLSVRRLDADRLGG